MIRAVVDPGVLVSALIGAPGNPPDRIVRAALAGDLQLVVSPRLIGELAGVLARPRFEKQAAAGRAERYVAGIASAAEAFDDPPEQEMPLTPDPADDYLVALARAARADVLVSGDGHLTGLENADPPVLTPRELVERLDH